MSMDEKNGLFLSPFTNGSIDANSMEENLSFSKQISEGSSCEDDADSNMHSVHSKILNQSHVEPIEPPTLVLEENVLEEEVGENMVGEHIQFEAQLDEEDATSDVDTDRLHLIHEEPITYLQLRRIGTDGRSMKRRRINE